MRALLRMFWNEPPLHAASGPGRRDWLLVALVFASAGLELALRPELSLRSGDVLWSLSLLPTLLWRRSRPFAMVALAFGLCTLLGLLAAWLGQKFVPLNSTGFLLLLPYSLLRHGAGSEALLGLPIVFAAAASDLLVGPVEPAELIGGLSVLCAAMALGAAVRYRERAHQRGIEQAKLEQREQLARDLHDTVAHHVSAIAIRAQAGLAVVHARPEAAQEALQVIADEASRTLRELRAIVRVLREDDAAQRTPQPRVADLARLAQAPGDGPEVDVALSGDLNDLSPSLEAALYRLAQESITNARRHARHATRIDVGVHADGSAVRLSVRDDGEPSAERAPVSHGYGLIGMTERAELLGGTCTAGPAPDRGWAVTVVLPRAGSSV